MPSNLALDDDLITRARSLGCHKTKREAVNAALKEYVERRERLGIIELFGTIDYDDDYDIVAERHRSTAKRMRLVGNEFS
jgi:Arc/MetJ family transcription regulator